MLRQACGCQWVMTKREMCSSQLNARETTTRSPEQKRRKHHHQQPQHHNSWAGSSRYRTFRANVLLKLETKCLNRFIMFIPDSTVCFFVFREMNKVSDRPGLGAEPVPVGAKLHVTVTILCDASRCLVPIFHFHFLSSRGRKKSPSFGTIPPTNKLCAKPCLHGSRSSSDLI